VWEEEEEEADEERYLNFVEASNRPRWLHHGSNPKYTLFM
jgi:hypothetical protein